MLVSARIGIQHHLPDAQFYILSDNPQHAAWAKKLGFKALRVPSLFRYRCFRTLLKAIFPGKSGMKRYQKDIPSKTAIPFDYVDAVVDVGGFANSDSFGFLGNMARLRDILPAVRYKLPTVYLSQSWGPFRTFNSAKLARYQLGACTLGFAREQASMDYLCQLKDSENFPICMAPDVAFGFPADSEETGRRILEAEGCNMDSSLIVGIVPNRQVYRRAEGLNGDNAYIRILAGISQRFLAKGTKVILISHHLLPGDAERDDRQLCRFISESVGLSPNLTSLKNTYSAAELKAVIGKMDMLVASRYHSIIAAFSQRVACVGIGWSHKYDELFKSVQLTDAHFSIQNQDLAGIEDKVLEHWVHRERLSDALNAHVPALEQASANAVSEAARHLGELFRL